MSFNLIWMNAGTNGTYTLADGSDSLGLTIATTSNASGATATAASSGTPSASGLWVSGISEPITSTLTFTAPVSNFSFEIYDIDSDAGVWDDRLTVLVTDAQGTVKAVSYGDLLGDPYHSSTGNTLNGDGFFSSGVETTGAADSVAVTIAGPVAKIQFVFDHGESAVRSGMFGVGNLTFERATLDHIVDGTADDDLIDDAYALDPEGDRVNANDAANGSDDDAIHAGAGNDTVVAGAGNDSVDAGLGADSVLGGAGNDTLNGEDGDDSLVGDYDFDSHFSVRGNPIAGPGGDDLLYGGAGNDSLYGGSGNDSLYGGDGDDSLLGGHGDDWLEGGAGNDEIEGLYGDDTIYGGDGNDHIFGRDGADLIYGGDGDDSLIGSIGIDTLYGGAGNDLLAGSQGSDLIYGGDGNDLVYIGAPAPGDIAYDSEGTIYLDAGNDYLDAGDATLKFDAYGGDGNDIMNAGLGDDTLFGGADNDKIYGGAGNDMLSGDQGDDALFGGKGDDVLYGGRGADTLTGGDGADQMFGGADRDLFYGGIGDVIDGGSGGDDFDTLDLSNLGGASMTNVIYGGGDNTAGRVDVLDVSGGVVGSFIFSNIESVIPCFTPGTLILTNQGEKPVEALCVGDKILTRDNGFQTLRWAGARVLSKRDLIVQPNFNPIRIRAGALGTGLPERDMTVSPQHRMLIVDPRAEMLFGEAEVLVAATHLINDHSILRTWPQSVTYIHLLFDQHEIICGDGAWTESFQPGDQSLKGMQSPQRDELLALFPALDLAEAYPAARLTLKPHEARVLMEL